MPLSNRVRFDVLKRDGFACHYCGARAPVARLEVDHIVPASAGGPDTPDNLITACFRCNRGKFTSRVFDEHDEPLDDAIARLFDSAPNAIAVIGTSVVSTFLAHMVLEGHKTLDGYPVYTKVIKP